MICVLELVWFINEHGVDAFPLFSSFTMLILESGVYSDYFSWIFILVDCYQLRDELCKETLQLASELLFSSCYALDYVILVMHN